jgi:RecA/RadA recombinase
MDTIDALVPTVVNIASMEDPSYGTEQAKLNSVGFKKVQARNYNTVFVAMNHVTDGMMGKYSSKKLPGGKAQEDFASMMIYVQRGQKIEENGKKVGFTMKATIEKDKVGGHQFDSCELPFRYEGGILDTIGGLISMAIENKVIVQDRANYEFLGQKIYDKNNLKEYIEKNSDIRSKLSELTIKA